MRPRNGDHRLCLVWSLYPRHTPVEGFCSLFIFCESKEASSVRPPNLLDPEELKSRLTPTTIAEGALRIHNIGLSEPTARVHIIDRSRLLLGVRGMIGAVKGSPQATALKRVLRQVRAQQDLERTLGEDQRCSAREYRYIESPI